MLVKNFISFYAVQHFKWCIDKVLHVSMTLFLIIATEGNKFRRFTMTFALLAYYIALAWSVLATRSSGRVAWFIF